MPLSRDDYLEHHLMFAFQWAQPKSILLQQALNDLFRISQICTSPMPLWAVLVLPQWLFDIHLILLIVADSNPVLSKLYPARNWLFCPHDQPQERRFPTPIWPCTISLSTQKSAALDRQGTHFPNIPMWYFPYRKIQSRGFQYLQVDA